MPLPPELLQYGPTPPPRKAKPLQAGWLDMIFEEGALRCIRLGNVEIVRRIYVAVRDRNWGTIPLQLSNVEIESDAKRFRVAFDADHREEGIDFHWHGEIAGDADSSISFVMDGVAQSSFERNRIGFCVLHPIREGAGAACRAIHPDGSVEEGTLPRLIAAQSPFIDLVGFAHEVAPEVWAALRFTGDLFEMEDQRNWTDASFKTYCTPLRVPYPVEVKAGETVRQSVELRMTGVSPIQSRSVDRMAQAYLSELEVLASPGKVSSVRPAGKAVPIPRLGLELRRGTTHSDKERERLRALNLSHLRIAVDPTREDPALTLRTARDEAAALGVGLEIALLLSEHPNRVDTVDQDGSEPDEGDEASDTDRTQTQDGEMDRIVAAIREANPRIERFLVYHRDERSASPRTAERARQGLGRAFPDVPIGAGSNSDFVDLNRFPPSSDLIDFACFAMNPQVHAFDNVSVVEALEAQPAVVESARALDGGRAPVISPVSLRRRYNPDATGPAPEPHPGSLPPSVDPRQMSLFTAAWTVGSIAALARAEVQSATYFETTGGRGVMEREEGPPLPDLFPSLPGGVFPVYLVLAAIGEFRGGEIIPMAARPPLMLAALRLRKAATVGTIIANLDCNTTPLTLSKGTAWVLDPTNAEAVMGDPESFFTGRSFVVKNPGTTFYLPPYAVVFVEGATE